MATPTLQQIKEVVTQVIEPFAQSVQKDFQIVNNRLDGIEGDLIGVKERLTNVEEDVRWMRDNSSALFEKLDRMIALFEKHEQEIAAMSVQMKRLEDRISKLEKNHSSHA